MAVIVMTFASLPWVRPLPCVTYPMAIAPSHFLSCLSSKKHSLIHIVQWYFSVSGIKYYLLVMINIVFSYVWPLLTALVFPWTLPVFIHSAARSAGDFQEYFLLSITCMFLLLLFPLPGIGSSPAWWICLHHLIITHKTSALGRLLWKCLPPPP